MTFTAICFLAFLGACSKAFEKGLVTNLPPPTSPPLKSLIFLPNYGWNLNSNSSHAWRALVGLLLKPPPVKVRTIVELYVVLMLMGFGSWLWPCLVNLAFMPKFKFFTDNWPKWKEIKQECVQIKNCLWHLISSYFVLQVIDNLITKTLVDRHIVNTNE